MLNEIKSLSWDQLLGAIFGILGIVSPGFLLIFLYKPELVSSLETIKLIIFSASFSLPIFIINIVLSSYVSGENDDQLGKTLGALLITAIALYPSILISYIYNLIFIEFLITLAIAQVILIIYLVLDKIYDDSKKQPNKQINTDQKPHT